MGIFRSYSDFTTRGGGVIEGLGGGRSRGVKLGPLYRKVALIPKTHILQRTVSNINVVNKNVSLMSPDRLMQISNDIELGYTVRLSGDTYLKQNKKGDIEIYLNKAEIQKAKLQHVSKSIPKDKAFIERKRKQQFDEIYNHLLEINQRANKYKK